MRVTMSQITPAIITTIAIPRPVPVPNQEPMRFAPRHHSLMRGIKNNSAIGPMSNAVIGIAADSMLCAIPNILPCFS